MKEKLFAMILTVVISIVLITTILMPVINDASTEDTKGSNTYYYRMNKLGNENMVLSYDADDGRLIDGATPDVTTTKELYVITDNAVIVSYGNQWYYYFVDSNGVYQHFNTNHTLLTDAVATFENGTVTVTYDSVDYTFSYTFVYYPNDNGSYIYTEPTNGVYVNKDTTIITFNGGASNNGVNVGNADGLTTKYHADNGVLDTETFEATIAVANAEMGLSTIKEVVSATPSKMIVPLDYHYLTEAEGAEYSMLSVIVVIVFAGVLLAVARMVAGRYD